MSDTHLLTLTIPLKQFSARLNDLSRAEYLSIHSRLALIHQTAIQIATEFIQQPGHPAPTVDIDELTNPPLFDLPIDEADEQQVVIRFSYQP